MAERGSEGTGIEEVRLPILREEWVTADSSGGARIAALAGYSVKLTHLQVQQGIVGGTLTVETIVYAKPSGEVSLTFSFQRQLSQTPQQMTDGVSTIVSAHSLRSLNVLAGRVEGLESHQAVVVLTQPTQVRPQS